jgi:multidrug/hemolysin transport system permease protein
VGFLAGAYVPPGVLSEGIVTAMNAMPFAQTAVLVRDGLATRPLDALGGGSTQGVDALRDMYGMDLVFGGAVASSVWAWVGLAVFGVVFFAGSALRARSLKAR